MNEFLKLEEKLNGFLNMGVPFYDIKIMKDGKCVYRNMDGYKDENNKIKPNGKELYNIYSCSKLITCTAALQLCEKGKFKPDDELYKYLPEFENMSVLTKDGVRPAKNKITIRQLFAMTAGLSYNLNSPKIELCKKETEGKCPTRVAMKYIAKEPLLFEPGYRWEYSLCHDVLAALVETVTGEKFGKYVKENIFDVANMKNSFFSFPENERFKLCNQYKYNKNTGRMDRTGKANSYILGSEYECGGAGCVSTVDDYVLFLEALRTNQLLKSETVDMISTNQLTKEQMNMPTYSIAGKRGYGLGQECPAENENRRDFGWGSAAGAHYFIDRRLNITACLMTHVLDFDDYMAVKGEIVPIIQKIFKK